MAGLTAQIKQSAGKGVDAFFAPAEGPSQDHIPPAPPSPVPAPKRAAPAQETEQLTAEPINQPLNQSTGRPVDPSVDRQLTGKVIERPVAFYLPEIINEKIDEAVDYMAKHHRVKVDRSAVVSAILGNPAVWEPESLSQLVDKALSQLTSRLTSRLTR